jgi:hypothetical protein
MRQAIDMRERVSEPCWQACAVLDVEADTIVRPAMNEMRVGIGGTEMTRKVQAEVGPRVRGDHGIRVPLRWHAEQHPRWFPELEAELRLVPVGEATTELRLVGTYEPPLGALGALGDRVAGHRVAETALREFLVGVAQRLADALNKHTQAARGYPVEMPPARS